MTLICGSRALDLCLTNQIAYPYTIFASYTSYSVLMVRFRSENTVRRTQSNVSRPIIIMGIILIRIVTPEER